MLAVQTPTHVDIRSSTTLGLIHSIQIPARFRGANVRWSPASAGQSKPRRIVLYNDSGARVENIVGRSGHAVIDRGSGGLGKIINVEFGRTDDELLVFQEFGSKVTLWNLRTARSVDIKDPKYASSKGFAFRPGSQHFTLLSRPGPQDVLTMHALNSYTVIWSVALPTTDAQGLAWSHDGRFVAIWDTPSIGYRVHIYTAAGDLYRIYSGDQTDGEVELGVRSVSWSPSSDYLAIGGYDRRVRLLSTRTFSPLMYLDHTTPIQLPASSISQIWHEELSGSSNRSYVSATAPFSPPTANSGSPADTLKEAGTSLLSFSPCGTYLATRHDATPTTAWIWAVRGARLAAVLAHHAPLRLLAWRPTRPPTLLLQCAHDDPALYLWEGADVAPVVLPVAPLARAPKAPAQWLAPRGEAAGMAPPSRKPAVLFGDARSAVVVWPQGRDGESEELPPASAGEDGDESLDSVFEALTGVGRSPFKAGVDGDTEILVSDVLDETTQVVDDTFVGRRGQFVGSY